MVMERVQSMLAKLNGDKPRFPPTILYNEGWLLRLVMDWFANHPQHQHRLAFLPGAGWYSEALLPSAFRPRFRADQRSEARTHADGVIGHIKIGESGKADLELEAGARQFLVLEAKMSSPLSSGTRNAPDFDQAARNVACMAEVLMRADRPAEDMERLGFYVLAPQHKIESGTFAHQIERDSITEKVRQRIDAYDGELITWYETWFLPLCQRVEIEAISWESLLAFIEEVDKAAGAEVAEFYDYCLKFN